MAHLHHYSEIKRVTLINGVINFLLALVKILIGYIGHSQALIADGLHSFSDLLSDALVILAAKAGGKTPDKEHPYGHRRIETVAAIIIAIMLTAVGLGLAYDTIDHLLKGIHLVPPSLAVIITAVISIIANEALYRYTEAAGTKINSNLLHSNAYHKRSDAFVSLIVLASVLGTYLGIPYLDATAAFIIGGLIIKMGIAMIMQSVHELIDTAVDNTMLQRIIKQIKAVSGVQSIHQLRTRSLGGSIFVDAHIIVDPKISVSEGHHIAEEVHLSLVNHIGNVMDVTVHIDPEDDEHEMPSIDLPNRAALQSQLEKHWKKLPGYEYIEKLVLHYLKGRLDIEVFIKLHDTKHSLQELSKLYQEAAGHIPKVHRVTLHFSQ